MLARAGRPNRPVAVPGAEPVGRGRPTRRTTRRGQRLVCRLSPAATGEQSRALCGRLPPRRGRAPLGATGPAPCQRPPPCARDCPVQLRLSGSEHATPPLPRPFRTSRAVPGTHDATHSRRPLRRWTGAHGPTPRLGGVDSILGETHRPPGRLLAGAGRPESGTGPREPQRGAAAGPRPAGLPVCRAGSRPRPAGGPWRPAATVATPAQQHVGKGPSLGPSAAGDSTLSMSAG